MKANLNKFRLLLNSNNKQEIKIGKAVTVSSQYEKLLGITIDCKLIVNIRNNLCKKADTKLHNAARVTPNMSFSKNACF